MRPLPTGDVREAELSGKPAYRYYNCSVTCRTGREACPGCRVRTDTMDTAVLSFLAGELFTPERCRTLLADAPAPTAKCLRLNKIPDAPTTK